MRNAPAVPRPPARAARATSLLCAAVLACAAGAARCGADGLDSVATRTEGASLELGFAIPLRSLRDLRMDVALEERGLEVDCVVTTELRKQGAIFDPIVVKTLLRRTLSYSRWYEEYALSENVQEVSTHKSYYAALDAFRRFRGLRVVDLGILDPGQAYRLRLEVTVLPRLAGQRSKSPDVALAGLIVSREMLELFRGKGALLSIRLDSVPFRGGETPGRLFADRVGTARASAP